MKHDFFGWESSKKVIFNYYVYEFQNSSVLEFLEE